MPSRRRTILALGGLLAGGGALIGTGAFDTVEAERTVAVETAGDAQAFLDISAGPQYGGEVITDTDDVFVIDIGGARTAEDGAGVNRRARTVFTELVELTNRGTQTVDSIDVQLEGDGSEILGVVDHAQVPLSLGDSTTFGLQVDLRDNSLPAVTDEFDINESEFDPIVRITAESSD